jgi:hypothetical protein
MAEEISDRERKRLMMLVKDRFARDQEGDRKVQQRYQRRIRR